jgi:hypothetical protein
MAGLKYGADLHSKWLTAVVTLVCTYASAFATHLTDTLHTTAMRAYRAVRPDTRFYESIGGFFVVKVWLGQIRHDCFSLIWKTVYALNVGT